MVGYAPRMLSLLRSTPTASFAWILVALLGTGCDVYTDTLVEGGAPSTGGSGPGGGGMGGEGGAPASCAGPGDCPGEDNECGTRTCEAGTCGVDAIAEGTLARDQLAGDCLKRICDGAGVIVGVEDNSDTPSDTNDCTNESCVDGMPMILPKAVGADCGNNEFCNADAECVECIDATDCPSMICTDTFSCAPAGCGDNTKNGAETDVDCGGPDCSGCLEGEDCSVAGDCVTGFCDNGSCAATCSDGVKNQDESDVDCGGVCDACGFGEDCDVGADCETGACNGAGTCSCTPNNGVLIISEVRARGTGGGNDDFVELFNPGSSPVTVSSNWTVQARSDVAGSYGVRFTGSGQVVPPGGHLLIGGMAYAGAVAEDATLSSGIGDYSSVIVRNGTTTVDAVCFSCGFTFGAGYECEGASFDKGIVANCTNNLAVSLERLPGGALGNCIDTQNNSADFVSAPSSPQNLNSPLTP